MSIHPATSLLRLFGLSGFAVAIPVLGVLRLHPQFLVAHGTTPSRLAGLLAGVLLLPPLLLWLVERMAAALGPRAAGAAHLGGVAVLAAAALLPPAARVLPSPGTAAVLAGLAAGALLALAYARSAAARSFASLSAAVPLVYVALFLGDPQISKLSSVARPGAVAQIARPAPVVMLLLDEFPLTSLLEAEHRIDQSRYPNFAALARTATWYENATSVSGTTKLAVPAILTGSYPDAERIPVARDYPANLFTLLRGTYALHVEESRTILNPEPWSTADLSGTAGRAGELASDLAILYAHFLAPDDWAERLPPVNLDWRGFAAHRDELEAVRSEGAAEKLGRYLEFVGSIRPCEGPCLYFVHTVLPHVPWEFTPQGRPYATSGWIPGLRKEDALWGSEDRWVVEGYQRHLFQVSLADRMLGELLAQLDEIGLLDRSLLVVAADHGSAFWPGEPRRELFGHPHPEDILRVPLFVKRPGQRRAEIDSRPVETVDILPTLADLLACELPWSVDGRSAVDPDAAPRSFLTGFANDGRRLRFDLDLLRRAESLERKLSLFGSGDGTLGLYALGPHRALRGRAADALGATRDPRLGIEVVDGNWYGDDRVPPRVVGRFLLRPADPAHPAHGPPVSAAVAIRGRVVSVAPAARAPDGTWVFSVFVPDGQIGAPRADFGIFAVMGPPGAEVVRTAPVRPGELAALSSRSWTP